MTIINIDKDHSINLDQERLTQIIRKAISTESEKVNPAYKGHRYSDSCDCPSCYQAGILGKLSYMLLKNDYK